jgi:hypothetical protein
MAQRVYTTPSLCGIKFETGKVDLSSVCSAVLNRTEWCFQYYSIWTCGPMCRLTANKIVKHYDVMYKHRAESVFYSRLPLVLLCEWYEDSASGKLILRWKRNGRWFQWRHGVRYGSRSLGYQDRGFESLSRMFVLIFLCWTLLCRYSPCHGPTCRPRCPINCRKTRFHNLI